MSSCTLAHALHASEHLRVDPCIEPAHAVACWSRYDCILLALGKINESSIGSGTFSVQLWLMRRGCDSVCFQIFRHPEPEVISLSFPPPCSPFLALICTGKSVSTTWISLPSTSQTSTAAEASSPLFSNFYCANDPVLISEQLDRARKKQTSRSSFLEGSSFECFPAGTLVNLRSKLQGSARDRGVHFQFQWLHPADVMSMERGLECDSGTASVAISPCGVQLASGSVGGKRYGPHSGQGRISLWCLRSGDLLTTFGCGSFSYIAYHNISAAVVLASYEGNDCGYFLPLFNGFKLWQ